MAFHSWNSATSLHIPFHSTVQEVCTYWSRPCRHFGQNEFGFWDFYVFHFVDPKILDFQVPRFPGCQISKFLDFQVARSPNCQISRSPDFQTPTHELSDPNLTPLPTHPGIKYVARSPCCDLTKQSFRGPSTAPNGFRKYIEPYNSFLLWCWLISKHMDPFQLKVNDAHKLQNSMKLLHEP